ncbi:PTS sugar transporter subunit IIB [Alkalibacterium sp. MB6]|uniref:PTS sugar transporter subunit IIB n=1 Tax=Alkalibacterium sp. MB6 TaxID=2081965 RepID=UPI001379CFB9|nr:PTS sugar transporter subunit IIB [Alkalibacterium sp. MB6]
MDKKVIMLICAAGMSSTLLVENMKKVAAKRGLDVTILAVSALEALRKLDSRQIDVLLVGPQVRYMIPKFEPKAAEKSIPIESINESDYRTMNGANVLDTALSLIKN